MVGSYSWMQSHTHVVAGRFALPHSLHRHAYSTSTIPLKLITSEVCVHPREQPRESCYGATAHGIMPLEYFHRMKANFPANSTRDQTTARGRRNACNAATPREFLNHHNGRRIAHRLKSSQQKSQTRVQREGYSSAHSFSRRI
jgi:hypothetical protein